MSSVGYQEIVFIQNHEADEPLAILDEQGVEAAIAYLLQWDYGEGEVRDRPSAGCRDTVRQIDDLLLTYNVGLGYIGLERIF
jgi:hypothetical protein